MTSRPFPNLTPSSRTYRPGKQSETMFRSQNGATSIVAFGGRFVDAELDMEFRNIPDLATRAIVLHYESVIEDDYVTFTAGGAFGGMTVDLTTALELGNELLRYRYKEPPRIESVYPGVSTVRVSFIGILQGS